MAVAVVKFKNGKKGMGTPHYDYIARQGKYGLKEDKLERLVDCDSGNMPEWAKDDPKFFWQTADEKERENGRIYKEHIIALPRELTDEQLKELARDLIHEHIGDKHPYSYAIHSPIATDGKEQPHLHFMYSERTLDGIERGADTFFKRYNSKNPSKGGCKKANIAMRKGEARQQAKELRQRIGGTINKHLEKANIAERVDMRSRRDIEKEELEQAQADYIQSQQEMHEYEQQADFDIDEINDILKRHALEQSPPVAQIVEPEPVSPQQAENVVIEPVRVEPPTPTKKVSEVTPKIPPPPVYETVRDEMKAIEKQIKEKLLKDELAELKGQGTPIFEEITALKANKPMFRGRGKWQKDMNELLSQYNPIKEK